MVTLIRSGLSSSRASAKSHVSTDGLTTLCGTTVRRPAQRDAASEDTRMICRACKKLHGQPVGLNPADMPSVIRLEDRP